MPKECVEPLEVGILVGYDLAEERVQVAKGSQLATPEFGAFLITVLEFLEPILRWIEGDVHFAMVSRALTSLGLEVDGAEPLDLRAKVDARSVEFGAELVHPGRFDLFAHLRPLVELLE